VTAEILSIPGLDIGQLLGFFKNKKEKKVDKDKKGKNDVSLSA